MGRDNAHGGAEVGRARTWRGRVAEGIALGRMGGWGRARTGGGVDERGTHMAGRVAEGIALGRRGGEEGRTDN